MMKMPARAVLALLLVTGPAGAVNCINNIPASNPDSAYTVNNGGTVTDTRTGLMWKVCAEGQTLTAGACTGAAATYTWDTALAAAEASTYAGYSDWRLPNLKELRSLIEECRVNPAINDTVFPNTQAGYIWSSSPNAYNPDYAWTVHFNYGDTWYWDRFYNHSVRLVRGG